MHILYHLADIHLGAASKYISNLLERQFEILESIAHQAVKDKVSAIIIAGDLFNSPHIPGKIIDDFLELAAGVPGIPWILASGTHGHDSHENEQSVYKRSSFSSLPDNIHLIDQTGSAVINNIAFYTDTHQCTTKLSADKHILVFHGTPEEASLFLNASKIKGFDYAAMGHFHYFDTFTVGSIPVAYPGTIIPFASPKGKTGLNESSYALVQLDKAAVIEKKQPAPEKFIRARIFKQEDLDSLEGQVNKDTILELWGSSQYTKDAASSFKTRTAGFSYIPVDLKDIPPRLIEVMDAIIQEQNTDSDIPWDLVREAALKLISGEEGQNYLKPDKTVPILTGGIQ